MPARRIAKNLPTAPGASFPLWIRLRQALLPGLLLVGLTFAAFAPSLSAGFVWDDDAYITENPHLNDLAGLRAIWFDVGATKMYVPLVFSTFWIEYRLWEGRPLGHHVVNVLLHGLGAVLLWLVLARLGLTAAWFAAALFAVHPVFVESVAWLTELKNTLSTVFCLLCLLAYFRFSPPAAGERDVTPRWGLYVLSLLAFAAALLSKPVVVALPLVLLLLLWWRRMGSWRDLRFDVAAVAPMLLLSLATGGIAMHVERLYGGARGAVWEIPWIDRFLVAGRALWFYAGKLLWPADLIPIYPRWKIDSTALWPYLYPLAAVGVVAGLWWFRGRLGRGPFVAVASFGLLLSPLVGFFNVSYFLNSYVADHFQHHAAPALLALFATAGASMTLRFPSFRRPASWAAAGLLVTLLVVSHRYTPAFENEERRCRTILERNPGSWLAMNNLGVTLNRRGAFSEAIGWFEKAIRTRSPYPEAESNLGVALVGLGRPQEAIEHYRESLRTYPENPLAHNNLGTALAQMGRIEEARRAYTEALRLRPDYAAARRNLEQLRLPSGAPSTSQQEQQAAGSISVPAPEAGEMDCSESVRELEAAVRLHPHDAELLNRFGMRLAACGRLAKAIEQFATVARLRPASVAARMNLATALRTDGRLKEALPPLEEALLLDSGSAAAHLLLGGCLAQLGRLTDARRHFAEAVRLDPQDPEAQESLRQVDRLLAAR
jgi:protein O-mannosyl-transferase